MSPDLPLRRPHRSRRRRRSLLCCLLLPSSVPAASRRGAASGATTPSHHSRDNLPRRHHADDTFPSHSRDHGTLSRIRQCPHVGYLASRGGATEDEGVQAESANESAPVDANDTDGEAAPPPALKAIKDDDGDEEIDAYIEQLIASVEDESGDKRSAGTFKVEEGGGETVVEAAEGSNDGEGEPKASQETGGVLPGPPDPVNDRDKGPVSASSDGAEGGASSDLEHAETLSAVTASQSAGAQKVPPESQAISGSVEATTSTGQPPPEIHPPSRRPPPPPNPLYRALLRRRGWGGHVVAMALVTVSEFCDLWLPLVVRAWDELVWKRLVGDPAPNAAGDAWEGRRRRRPPPASAKELESKVRSSQRSGTNRKHLKELQRQADQAALQVLRQLKRDSKYRYTSLAFQQRHGLGQFAAAASRAPKPRVPDPSSAAARMSSSGAKSNAKVSGGQEGNDEDDDVDWILDALTATNDEELVDNAPAAGRSSASTSKPKTAVQPRVALEVGPGGPSVSVGVEFSLGGSGSSGTKRRSGASPSLESVIRGAVAKQRSTKSTTSRVVTSDRDSGVLGRIRAAASDGIGRSLLGAYPGDAAPISEAANPRGVLDLASRYGYGDWSELDDDDEEEEVDEHDHDQGSHKTRRRKRRKRSDSSRPVRTRSPNKSRKQVGNALGVDFDFDVGSGLDDGALSSSRGRTIGAISPSRIPSRHSNTLPTQPLRPQHRSVGQSSGRSSTASRRADPIRPAMERTNDAKRKSVPETGRGAPIGRAMKRVNNKRRRKSNGLDDDG